MYKEYKKTAGLGDHSLAPCEQEVLASPRFVDVLEREGNAPITAEDFNTAVAALPNLVSGWRKSKMVEVLKAIAGSGGPPVPDAPSDSDLAVLGLAKTILRCNQATSHADGNVLNWQSLGRHSCCRTKAYPNVYSDNPSSVQWSFDCLQYDADSSQMIQQLIIAAGRDPKTATADEMDDMNARFYCINCAGQALARTWRNCVRLA